MGFLSYSLRFYRDALQTLEHTPATPDKLDHARQLLRMLDDLTDEGYPELNEQLEAAGCDASRLRDYLRKHRTAPFPTPGIRPDSACLPYAPQETELCSALRCAMQEAAALPDAGSAPFTDRLRQFCRWIGYDDRTAYLFLLRDTLLPFVYYAAQGRERIHPWLLSRSSFASLTGQRNADDAFRASIYKALESGCTSFPEFSRLVLPDMRQTLAHYPQAARTLRTMLERIDAERILVVESGCAGTFPLLLMSLDPRVELRMYTTYPYLTGIYGPRVFTSRYEENRRFETMASQALFLRFSGFRNGGFSVQTCTDPAVRRQALEEIRMMQNLKNRSR